MGLFAAFDAEPILPFRISKLAILLIAAVAVSITCAPHPLDGQNVSSVVPPVIKHGIRDFPLPAAVDEVVVGGGGRYLLMHFPSLRVIGLFDVN